MELRNYKEGKEVTFLMERKVKVGANYRLNSSYGYSGISSEVVEVKKLLDQEDVESLRVGSGLFQAIEMFKESELSICSNRKEVNQAKKWLENAVWIVYKGRDGTQVLPAEVFIEHLSVV
jgi:hypothetical protein